MKLHGAAPLTYWNFRLNIQKTLSALSAQGFMQMNN